MQNLVGGIQGLKENERLISFLNNRDQSGLSRTVKKGELNQKIQNKLVVLHEGSSMSDKQ